MSNFESFTSLDSFSKLTKYPQKSLLLCGLREPPASSRVTIVSLVYFGGTNHLSGFDNKVTGNPAIMQLRRNRSQHCRWQLKFVTLSSHVLPLATCTLNFLYHVEAISSPCTTLDFDFCHFQWFHVLTRLTLSSKDASLVEP